MGNENGGYNEDFNTDWNQGWKDGSDYSDELAEKWEREESQGWIGSEEEQALRERDRRVYGY